MKIKSIKLYGFKSFPGETNIVLHEGITAFVGPNGSGKSNIFDALRWVFGEQSMKALRCEKIEDLVYMSPDSRNDANFNEVSVTIDNEDYFPQFGGEFEIKRRFYRTGESEFFLNRVKCRLLDIQALFLNSGALSYSFLELSEIEKIIHGDTKQMFDDVSGILKYQERREQTRRRLESTEQDLLRLEDIIHEMQRSVRSLRRQVRQTRLHQELRNEYKEVNLFLLKNEYKEAQDKLVIIEEQMRCQENEKQNIAQKIKALEEQRKQLKQEMAEIEHKKKDTTAKLNEFDTAIEHLLHLIEEKEEASRQLSLSNERVKAIIKEKEEVIALDQQRLDEFKSIEDKIIGKIKEVKNTIEKQEVNLQEKNNKYFSLRAEKEKYSENIALSSDKIKELKENIVKVNFERDNKQEILLRVEKEYEAVKQELDNARRSKQLLEKELEKVIDEQSKLTKELEENLNMFKRYESNIGELDLELKERDRLLSECRLVIDTLHHRLKNKEGVREIEEHFKTRHSGLLRDNIKVEAGYEALVDLCFGDLLHFYLLSDFKEDDFAGLPDGRFGFIDKKFDIYEDKKNFADQLTPISQFIKFKDSGDVLQKYIRNYFFVDDFVKANELSRKYPGYGFATKQGILCKNGLVIVEKGEIGYFKIKQSLEEYEKKYEELKNEVIFLNEDKKRIEHEIEDINKAIEEKKNRIFIVNVKKSECSLKLSEVEREIEKLTNHCQTLGSDKVSLSEECELLSRKLTEFRAAVKTAEMQYNEIMNSRAKLSVELEALEKELEHNDSLVNKIKMELVGLEERYKNTVENRRQQEEEIEKIQQEIKLLKQQQASEESGQIESQLSKLKQELILKKEQRTQLAQILPEKQIDELTQKLNQIFDELTNSQKLYESVQNDVMQLKYESFQLMHKKDEVLRKAREDFKVELNNYHPEEEIVEPRARLEELRGKIEKIGEVNPLSLELYEREKKRLDDFLAQRDDIIAAKKNLIGSIEELDNRAQERFIKTFEQVKEQFNFVFANFFEGGTADLVLTNDANPLVSKVDIIVRMKGKRLKTINQLSGGERTLLAISLLLAFYLVKPAPFCILDEIDAPLDDANVVRFNKFLRDLSQRTQVIIITHNRATMEYADYLYGVTMEKPGQSKIVSAKLADLEKLELDA